MVFFIFFGATLFSFVFRSLGGDDIVRGATRGNGPGYRLGNSTFLMVLVVRARVLLRLDRDLPDRAAGVRARASSRGFQPAIGAKRTNRVPHWFIIMMSVNLQTSFLTPPFGFTLFYMKGTVPHR